MTADDLQRMLSTRHAADVYVAECKDGPSQTRAHRRLDAWVLLKTWSPITTIGYEIKVTRQDWRRDEKMHDYMPLCHLLYIAAPKGIVPADELPTGVGLIEPIGTNGRLQVRRKAARREIALPAELMVYVLMCRTRITRDRNDYHGTDAREWRVRELREWVEGRHDREALSMAVSQKIRAAFDEQARQLRAERTRHDTLEHIEQRIAELGLDPKRPVTEWDVRKRLEAFNAVVSWNVLHDMRRTGEAMLRSADALEAIKNRKLEEDECPA
jgi:hypothetical protein